MSCYYPFFASWDQDEKIYKIQGRYSPGMEFMNPRSISIPCGKCLGCRLEYSRQWADRMMLELETKGKGIFITLTYDNAHVPLAMLDEDEQWSYTLEKRDFQLFMKRFRKKFSDFDISFYASGEYGFETYRPHYHAIIFGIGLSDLLDKRFLGVNEFGNPYYDSEAVFKTWKNGFISISDVSWRTCAYVARYVLKKVNGPVENLTAFRNAEPEFSLMSRNPGIGSDYFKLHPEIFERPVFVPGGSVPKKVTYPKYFFNKLKLTDEKLFDKLKAERLESARDSVFLKMQQTDLSFVKLMELEEDEKWKKIHQLKRK